MLCFRKYYLIWIVHKLLHFSLLSISHRYVIIQQQDIFEMLTFCEVLIRYKTGMAYLLKEYSRGKHVKCLHKIVFHSSFK